MLISERRGQHLVEVDSGANERRAIVEDLGFVSERIFEQVCRSLGCFGQQANDLGLEEPERIVDVFKSGALGLKEQSAVPRRDPSVRDRNPSASTDTPPNRHVRVPLKQVHGLTHRCSRHRIALHQFSFG